MWSANGRYILMETLSNSISNMDINSFPLSEMEESSDYLFVYGILKRGFSLDLSSKAEFIGEAILPGARLYRIGGGVGLRFTIENSSDVFGEVFRIPKGLWKWLDSIEHNGISYTRRIVGAEVGNPEGPDFGWMRVWVYEHTYPGMVYDDPIENGRFENAAF
jgi:gamma-glutamylcyclotransferase (GGCT)/AIG2-like uncharacterized protein YtfP